jgi:tetratricopeptide (TPR) repeat protein
MKILKIYGKKKIEDRVFLAEVVFPSDNRYKVTVRDPFLEPGAIETDQEERLRWYFEEHLMSPYTDKETAKRAAGSIIVYGESLFSQLFSDANALTEWRDLTNGLDKTRVQVYSDDREFQALHWEALKDPDESAACCLKDVEFIRTSGVKTPKLEVKPSTCLNVLMVTARPRGKNDVDYRTITRPVMETVEKNRMRVRVHLLRPPTFRRLKEHLREKKGFYHIAHFDVHGNVLSFEEYKAVMGEGKGVLSGGRRGMDSYKGTKAFILLVSDHGGIDLVTAEDAAELLQGAHVPLCFFNACRSGMVTLRVSDSEGDGFSRGASLAMSFLERGVRLVLGMAWSLTVPAAQIMITRLYDTLTRGEEPGTALNMARQALFEEGCRYDGTDCTVLLEDWLLPVVWGKGDFSVKLQTPYPEDSVAFLERERLMERELERIKRKGVYGFLGRDVDILAIEELLLERNILLVKGMGGTGKTTLLGHLGEWWFKTGWLDHVFYFSYDQKPYQGEEILNTIAEAVMSRSEFDSFMGITDVKTKVINLTNYLKEGKETSRVLLILDNMESITGTEQAVGSRLEKGEQKRLTRVLKRLMRSSVRILLGSRSDERWLGKHTFKHNVYVLEGLDHVSRFELAERILGDTPVADWAEFNLLMDILAGYPLAMEIMLPNLGQRSSKELREVLTGAGVDLQGGKISEEIFKCINISFLLLTEKERETMLVFAPFTSFLNSAPLEVYLKELQVFEFFSHLTLEDLEEVLGQGEKQGLLKEIFPKFYSIQPVFPFFLGEQVAHSFGSDGLKGMEQAFCRYMSWLAIAYKQLMESKEAEERQMSLFFFRRDRENLYKALHQVLDKEGNFYSLYNVFAHFYHRFSLHNEAIEFMEAVVKKLEFFSSEEKDFLGKYACVRVNLGTNYLKIKNFSKAKDNYEKGLTLYRQAGKRKPMATAYHQLGIVAFEERDWVEAKCNYREALNIYQEFNDRYSQASTYHELGYVAQEERDWVEAKRNYREALIIYQKFNDRYSQAGTYHQLGWVAQEEHDWVEAKHNYREAMKIKEEFNDRYSQASTYHNLGTLAAEEHNWVEAKRNYREALKLFQEFNDRYSQASTYCQLGYVAGSKGDWEESKRNCREALKIYQKFNNRYEQARPYNQLGMVAEEETDYASSLAYYVTALEIFTEYNDEHSLGIVIRSLSRLLAVDQWDAARAIEVLEVGEETKKVLWKLLEKIKKAPSDD